MCPCVHVSVCPGVCVVFQTSLAIMELLEPLLLVLNDETTVLPLLLRVPVNMWVTHIDSIERNLTII